MFTTIVEEHGSDGGEGGEFSLTTVEKVMAGAGVKSLPIHSSWVLLDSQSTCNVVKDKN